MGNKTTTDRLDVIKRIVDIGFVVSFISVLVIIGWKILIS